MKAEVETLLLDVRALHSDVRQQARDIGACWQRANTFFGAEALLESVDSGAIAPISGRWLVAHARAGGVMKRRQELPSEAFVAPSKVHRLVAALGEDFGLAFVALSYRWLAAGAADPDRFHLQKVARVAKMYLEAPASDRSHTHVSPLAAAFEKHGIDEPADFCLFWDFGSLFQPPRTAAQTTLFRRGLERSNVWYGHHSTVAWLCTELPPSSAADQQTYGQSGWCYVEAAMSAAIKVGNRRLDLALVTPETTLYGGECWIDAVRLDAVCAARRLPPPLPETVAHLLATEKRFTHQGDVHVVGRLYADYFAEVCATATSLEFSRLDWTVDELRALLYALPRFRVLRRLDLSHNFRLGASPGCAESLADAACALPQLETLHLDHGYGLPLRALTGEAPITALDMQGCRLGAASAKVIARLLGRNSTLTNLDCRMNAIHGDGDRALSEAILASAHLEVFGSLPLRTLREGGARGMGGATESFGLDLSNRHLMAAEIQVLTPLLAQNAGLTSLNLSFNGVQEAEARALAAALETAPALTLLDVDANPFLSERGEQADEAKRALRAAAARRPGFVLKGL